MNLELVSGDEWWSKLEGGFGLWECSSFSHLSSQTLLDPCWGMAYAEPKVFRQDGDQLPCQAATGPRGGATSL